LNDFKRDLDKYISATLIACPFVGSILRRLRIVATNHVETAAVSKTDILYINPDFWNMLPATDKAFTLAHEAMHIAMRDFKREGEKKHRAWNIVCDAVNNELLIELMKKPEKITVIFLYDLYKAASINIDYNDFKKMSKEEIYKLLKDKCKSGGDLSGDLSGKDFTGVVVREGDPEIYSSDKEDREEKWKQAVAVAYQAQKSIGKVPLGLKRIVDAMLKSKVPWTTILRQAVKNGLGKTIVSTYIRPSRKHEAFPGMRRFTIPSTWILIDTSGSIGQVELSQFMGEVYNVASLTDVKVICWDAYAYEILQAKNKNQVISIVMKKIRGGGGTEISKALEKTLKNMKKGDIVIVLTDGEIYDMKKAEKLFRDVSVKSSKAIFVSTCREHKIPGWTFIKI